MSITINSMSSPCRDTCDRLLLHSLTMPDAGDGLSARNVRLVFENVCKPLEVQFQPCRSTPFHCLSDVSSTPSSPPEAPSSLPPRPALTGLGLTRVAGRVVSYPVCTPSHHQTLCRDPRRDVRVIVSDAFVVDPARRMHRF